MKVIVYKYKSDGSIWKVDSVQGWIDKGKTIEDIEEAVVKYNEANLKHSVSLHDVAECDEELINWIIAGDGYTTMTDNPVHSCNEEIPADKYVYVLNKHKNHLYPSISVMKIFSGGVRVPELKQEPGSPLPIAWITAQDMWNLLGLSKKDVTQYTQSAKFLASFWYKED